MVANPIIYRLVPSPSRFEIRQLNSKIRLNRTKFREEFIFQKQSKPLTSIAKLAFSRSISSAMSSPSCNLRLTLGLEVSTLTTNSGRIYRSSYKEVPCSLPHRAYGFRQGVLLDCIHHSGSRKLKYCPLLFNLFVVHEKRKSV